jgi:hypothetical protein
VLQVGDSLPHFEVTTVTGDRFAYRAIWQRKNCVLVLVCQRDEAVSERWSAQLRSHLAAFAAVDTVCVVTADTVEALPECGVVVADRWGEIVHVITAVDEPDLPTAPELVEWAGYVQRRCPECEGETR